MKLHLPLFLRCSLLSVLALAPVWGGTLSSEVDLQVYADFGQNRGRYSTSNVNALLQELNKNGVTISYNNGAADYTLEHGMISFDSRQENNGASAAVCYNYIATVSHNGVQNPYFSYLELGEANSIQYKGIEYRYPNYFDNGTAGAFIHSAPSEVFQADFKLTRLSKIVTDVTTSNLYSSDKLTYENVYGELLYRSGGGYSDVYNPETGVDTGIERCITGAILQIDGLGKTQNGNFWMGHTADGWDVTVDPLPFGVNSGDSGSPVWIWDDEAKEYRYVAAVALEDGNLANGTSKGNLDFAAQVVDSYDRTIATASSQIILGQTSLTDETISQDSVSTTLWKGEATDAQGNVLASYTGVQNGLNTWNDMAAIRDLDNWYARTQDYLNAGQNNTTEGRLDYADLFMTDNLVFQATDNASYEVILSGDLDLGIGYTEFTKGNQTAASYTIKGDGYLDSAGYVIGEGVDVYLQLVSDDKTRELRKIGAGNLHLEGTGNSDVMLNLGGSGKTYLNQKDGYAAYNVLANNGSTVVLEGGVAQIKRDFTFGSGGGTLDFHGRSWTEGAEGNFSLKALTQDAIIANYKSGTTADVTFTSGGTFLGSFRDAEDAALKVHYAGSGTWTLNSIHTRLSHAASGLSVDSGKVVLVGTNTEHAAGNLAGTSKPWNNANDWHYADAAMNVEVKNGAVFELGSHARLSGTVTVNAGGTYIMREGVQNRYEYIEGGYKLEDTYAISSFYGHKGDTVLNGALKIVFSEGTTSNLTYAGNISGTGSLMVNTAGGTLTLTGKNTFTGTKELQHGHVIADNVAALGAGAGWQIAEGATLTVQSGLNAGNILSLVDASGSSGLLALGNDVEHAVDLSGSQLILGAESGKTVRYGDASETIHSPRLGGGGGTLEVYGSLAANDLVVGRAGEQGVVRLMNENNALTGTITMHGQVALDATSTAIGNAKVHLGYGSGMMLRESAQNLRGKLTADSSGSFLLDYYSADSVDMSGASSLSLSAAGETVYAGTINISSSDAYRLGGFTGSLELSNNGALKGANALVVDAKGTTGGRVVLAAQSGYSGAVTVQDGSGNGAGKVTLAFSQDNALASASGSTVNRGGVLDVGSTTQTIRNLQVNEGGLLTSESGGTLVFDMQSEKYQYGSMRLDNAEKTGSANLVLAAADNEWNLFTVKQGTLFTRVNNSLSATGITRVESGATLNLNTWDGNGFRARTMHGNIQLGNGANMTTGTGNFDVTLTGTFGVDAGGSANVQGGKWHLTGADYNNNGGTVAFTAAGLYLDSATAQRIGGTVSIDKSTSFHSTAGADNMLKQFSHINIAADQTLKLEDTTWNTIWSLDKLTGSGNLEWNSDTTHSKTARVIIGGNGGFSGNIVVNRSCDDQWYTRKYQALLQIDGENAICGATVNLNGAGGDDSHITLAINASTVNIAGLKGNAYSHLIAGAAPVDSGSTTAPSSTASRTLSLTGTGVYEFAGSVAGDSSYGLNLAHSGSGTQRFTGSSVVIHDASSIGGGVLDLSGSASLQVLGNLEIGQNSRINLGTLQYSLDSGKSLTVSGSGATLNAGLDLNGGSLIFDAAALDQTGFDLGGSLSVTSGAVINFTGLTTALDCQSFTLTTGDWSGVLNTLSSADLIFMRADFTTNGSGNLVVTFARNGYLWNGTDSAWSWSTSAFSTDTSAPNANSNVVFSDAAAKTTVNVDGDVSASSLYFENSSKDYQLSDAGGSKIVTNTIVQTGSGKTTIDPWTVIKSGVDVQSGTLVLDDADFDGSGAVISVADGELSLKLGEKETVSSLVLKDGANFKLTGNKILTVSNGVQKNIEGAVQMSAYGSSSITDNKSDYAVNGGSLHIGSEAADGSVILKSVSLKNGGELHVEGGDLGLENGISAGAGQSSVHVDGGNLVLSKDYVISGVSEGGSLDINIRNGGLYAAGISTKSAKIKLQDGGVLASSAYESLISHYACDIELSGKATVSDSMCRLMSSKVSTTSAVGNIELSGKISSAGDADLHVDVSKGGRVVISGEAAVSGDITVAASGHLGVADKLAVTVKDEVWSGSQASGVQISSRNGSADAAIAGGSKLAWADGTAMIHGTAAGPAQVSNALVELYDGATLSLQNVVLGSDSQIKTVTDSASATISASNVGLHVVTPGTALTLNADQSLTLSGSDESYTLKAGSQVLSITTDVLAGSLTLTGESLMVSFDGYDLAAYDAVQLQFGAGVTVDSTMLVTGQAQVEQGTAPQMMTGSYVTNGNVGSIVFIMNHNIPEPTTSTLSLLALAGLAMRRRRR